MLSIDQRVLLEFERWRGTSCSEFPWIAEMGLARCFLGDGIMDAGRRRGGEEVTVSLFTNSFSMSREASSENDGKVGIFIKMSGCLTLVAGGIASLESEGGGIAIDFGRSCFLPAVFAANFLDAARRDDHFRQKRRIVKTIAKKPSPPTIPPVIV